jgi:hypothetical protein
MARQKVVRNSDLAVRVEGLAKLDRALRLAERQADRDFLKSLGAEAAGVVVRDAQSLASAPRERRIAGLLKASSSATTAKVRLGGRADALGAEFGGRGRRSTQQFRPHTGQTGYFLFPAVRAKRERVLDDYRSAVQALIDEIARQAT